MAMRGRPLKRMKRRVTADLYDFMTFPDAGEGVSCPGGCGAGFDEPFRSRVRSFLLRHARPLPSHVPHLMTWQIAFRVGDAPPPETVVVLHVVEEDVSRSRSVYCDQCRVVGWSGHPVCAKRYHFIIRGDYYNDGCSKMEGWMWYNNKVACLRCGGLSLEEGTRRCRSCKYEMTAEEVEDWMLQSLQEESSHVLHGVVHSNGYGHLLKINGREGGSKFLSGSHVMDFWDRLCKFLFVRKISVMDISKKFGLEYRLLHAVVSGHPWYGNWGYEFGTASFAHTDDAYQKAVSFLSNMPLAPFFTHTRTARSRLQDVIAFYQSFSEEQLTTVRDLFCFILGLYAIRRQTTRLPFEKIWHTVSPNRPWVEDDIKRVESAMMKVLQAVGKSRWITWRTLKGAVSRAGSAEQIDYCLKELGGKSIDGMVVQVWRNPETDIVEYRLEDGNAASTGASNSVIANPRCLSGDHLLHDLKFLYQTLLYPETMLNYKPHAMREIACCSAIMLLDCKHFVKSYEFDTQQIQNQSMLRVMCQVKLVDQAKDYTSPPPECIVLPLNATVADLKMEATKAFREVYILFKRFQAERLVDFGGVDDSTNVKFLVGMDGSACIAGRCIGSHGLHRFCMERGTDMWTVKCICGARDDDGERMLACDECSVWQHTRCAGIHDLEAVPAKFICGTCKGFPKAAITGRGSCKDDLAMVTDCSNDIVGLGTL